MCQITSATFATGRIEPEDHIIYFEDFCVCLFTRLKCMKIILFVSHTHKHSRKKNDKITDRVTFYGMNL